MSRFAILSLWFLLMGGTVAHARVDSQDCEGAVANAKQWPIHCVVEYVASSELEQDLLKELSYGLAKSVSCNINLVIDRDGMRKQLYETGEVIASDLKLDCIIDSLVSDLPMTLTTDLRVVNETSESPKKVSVANLSIVGYPDIYVGQIMLYFNNNFELRQSILNLFDEYILTQ